jgi:S1-C subfamily serine protease
MEDLTKQQLVLLVLLVSFVTSIATGIITFTLLQEAPVEVTQTINRVVEKTIERVVTEEGEPGKVVTTTVVVNEEDRVLEAISKNEKSIVRFEGLASDGSRVITGLGLVLTSNGVIVTDLKTFNASFSRTIVFSDGKKYSVNDKNYIDNENGLVFVKVGLPKTEASKMTFTPALLADSDKLKIGQTLVAISGKESNAVSIGRVRQLISTENGQAVEEIVSDIAYVRGNAGSPAVNLSGEVIGIEEPTAEGERTYTFVPSNKIKSALAKALENLPN